jgi:hypothetical protein
LSIATFLRFSPSGFANSSSATSPTRYHIAVLKAPFPDPIPAKAHDVLNIAFSI